MHLPLLTGVACLDEGPGDVSLKDRIHARYLLGSQRELALFSVFVYRPRDRVMGLSEPVEAPVSEVADRVPEEIEGG